MALPHSINITSGGTGADPGEMFYGDQVDRIDGPPGSGSRGFAPGEDALSKNFNRSAFALAENDEYLGDILVKQELAYNEVGALTTFTGNSIDIDPSGGAAGDINYTGSLYLGDSGWLTGQEALDTIFQLLDENYNEVLVDGVEVKVTSLTGGAVGGGFVSTLVTLNLNKTLPSGNYRVAYGRGTTYEDLPAYALIRADVRGLQESSAESQRKAMYVCAPTGGEGDYVGDTAITDAITDLGDDCMLFVRDGTYSYGASMNITNNNVTIIGESLDGVIIDMDGGAYDITLSGDYISIENVKILLAAARYLYLTGSHPVLRNVDVTGGSTGSFMTYTSSVSPLFERMVLTDVSLSAATVSGVVARNVDVMLGASNTQTFALALTTGGSGVFEECSFVGTAMPAGSSSIALKIGDSAAEPSKFTFRDCSISSNYGVARVGIDTAEIFGSVIFEGCRLVNTASAFYDYQFARFLGHSPSESGAEFGVGIVLQDCYLEDVWCSGSDGSSSQFPVVELEHVNVNNLRVSRAGFTGSTYYIDGPLIRATYCNIKDLTLIADGMTQGSPYTQQVSNPDGVLLEVLDSSIQGLHLYDIASNQNAGVPLIYLKGSDFTASGGRLATIDGLDVHIINDFKEDSTDVGALAELAGWATLSRMVFNIESGDELAVQSLITITGQYCTVCDSIVKNTVGSDAGIQVFVKMPSGIDCSYSSIVRNVFRKTAPLSGAAVTHAALHIIPTTSTCIDISENRIYFFGLLEVSPLVSPVYIGVNVTQSRVVDNHIVASANATQPVFMTVMATDAGSGGDQGCGANDVAHNRLFSSSSTAPVITYGTTAKNDATNIRTNS